MPWMDVWTERAAHCPNLRAWQSLIDGAAQVRAQMQGAAQVHDLAWLLAQADVLNVNGQYNPRASENGVNRVFRAFEVIAPSQVRVAIIGQDPYLNPTLATGVAFATPQDAPRSDSLAKIFAKIREVDDGFQEPTFDLAAWIANGVLLLNASLTWTDPPNDAAKAAWRNLVAATLDGLRAGAILNQHNLHVVLLGEDAQSTLPRENQQCLHVRRFSHPTARPNARNHFRDGEVFRGLPHFWEAQG